MLDIMDVGIELLIITADPVCVVIKEVSVGLGDEVKVSEPDSKGEVVAGLVDVDVNLVEFVRPVFPTPFNSDELAAVVICAMMSGDSVEKFSSSS